MRALFLIHNLSSPLDRACEPLLSPLFTRSTLHFGSVSKHAIMTLHSALLKSRSGSIFGPTFAPVPSVSGCCVGRIANRPLVTKILNHKIQCFPPV